MKTQDTKSLPKYKQTARYKALVDSPKWLHSLLSEVTEVGVSHSTTTIAEKTLKDMLAAHTDDGKIIVGGYEYLCTIGFKGRKCFLKFKVVRSVKDNKITDNNELNVRSEFKAVYTSLCNIALYFLSLPWVIVRSACKRIGQGRNTAKTKVNSFVRSFVAKLLAPIVNELVKEQLKAYENNTTTERLDELDVQVTDVKRQIRDVKDAVFDNVLKICDTEMNVELIMEHLEIEIEDADGDTDTDTEELPF